MFDTVVGDELVEWVSRVASWYNSSMVSAHRTRIVADVIDKPDTLLHRNAGNRQPCRAHICQCVRLSSGALVPS
jgi:hypothetical protein